MHYTPYSPDRGVSTITNCIKLRFAQYVMCHKFLLEIAIGIQSEVLIVKQSGRNHACST